MSVYEFESIGRFRNRVEELAAIEDWFERPDEPRALLVHGRRRVGKSWLFRAFAHRREADIFVASTVSVSNPHTVLVSRSGFTPGLTEAAEKDRRITLVDVSALASG